MLLWQLAGPRGVRLGIAALLQNRRVFLVRMCSQSLSIPATTTCKFPRGASGPARPLVIESSCNPSGGSIDWNKAIKADLKFNSTRRARTTLPVEEKNYRSEGNLVCKLWRVGPKPTYWSVQLVEEALARPMLTVSPSLAKAMLNVAHHFRLGATALKVLQKMMANGKWPDNRILYLALSTCASQKMFSDICETLQAVNGPIKLNQPVYALWIQAASLSGRTMEAYTVLKEMITKGYPAKISQYNHVMVNLTQAKCWQEALELYISLLKVPDLHPDTCTFNTAIMAANQGKKWADVLDIQAEMKKRGVAPTQKATYHFIHACQRTNLPALVPVILDDWLATGGLMDAKLVRMAVETLHRTEKYDQVVKLYAEMAQLRVVPDRYTYLLVLSACRGRLWHLTERILDDMQHSPTPPDTEAFNVALKALQRNLEHSHAPLSRRTVPVAAARESPVNTAANLLQKMRVLGLVQDRFTRTNVLSLCHYSSQPDEARAILEPLIGVNVLSCTADYNMAMQGLHSQGKWKKIMALYSDMLESQIPRDFTTYSHVLGSLLQTNQKACAKYMFDHAVALNEIETSDWSRICAEAATLQPITQALPSQSFAAQSNITITDNINISGTEVEKDVEWQTSKAIHSRSKLDLANGCTGGVQEGFDLAMPQIGWSTNADSDPNASIVHSTNSHVHNVKSQGMHAQADTHKHKKETRTANRRTHTSDTHTHTPDTDQHSPKMHASISDAGIGGTSVQAAGIEHKAGHESPNKHSNAIGSEKLKDFIENVSLVNKSDLDHCEKPCDRSLEFAYLSHMSKAHREGQRDRVLLLFEQALLQGIVSAPLTNRVLLALLDDELWDGAWQFYNNMKEKKLQATPQVYYQVCRAAVKSGNLDAIQKLFVDMQAAGCYPTPYMYGMVIEAVPKLLDKEKAAVLVPQLFDAIAKHTERPDTTVVMMAASAYYQLGLHEQVVQLFEATHLSKAIATPWSYSMLLNSLTYATSSIFPTASQVIGSLPVTMELTWKVYQSALDLCFHRGDVADAMGVLSSAKQRGHHISTYMYERALDVCVKAKDVDHALDLLLQMLEAGHVPTTQIVKRVRLLRSGAGIKAKGGKLFHTWATIERLLRESGMQPAQQHSPRHKANAR